MLHVAPKAIREPLGLSRLYPLLLLLLLLVVAVVVIVVVVAVVAVVAVVVVVVVAAAVAVVIVVVVVKKSINVLTKCIKECIAGGHPLISALVMAALSIWESDQLILKVT